MKGPYTVIAEYFRTDTELSGMETLQRASYASPLYYARKRLKSFALRPTYVPEVARVEDADEEVVAVYDWDQAAGKPTLRG
jgi:hypothetical protein